MIHVFFVPGMFGSTIEYITRSYSNELIPVAGKVLADGSMHSFSKSAHFRDILHINDFFKIGSRTDVTTPIYPFRQHKLPEILKNFGHTNTTGHACILMYADSVESAELNMLFQYHKISVGLDAGLDIFCYGNEHNITSWDTTYCHWSQMKHWQLREWISLFYESWIQEWIVSAQQVGQEFLTIKNTDFLFNSVTTANKIFDHCKLTQKPELGEFLNQWQQAQKYIVDEFDLLDQIVNYVISNQPLRWQPVNIIAEAIVQQRLRAKGYEICCDGLDIFPTDAIMFNSLLEKVHQ
jgi:hypothetical protein